MTIEQIKIEFSKLPMADKLLLVEDMWDSIAETDKELPLSDTHRKELDERYGAYQEGGVELRDWKSVHESIRDKHK